MTSSSVLPYPAPVVTLTQREALRPQSCRIVAAPLNVPFDPATHRVNSLVPRLNHFVAGRGRPDALLLHVLRSFRVVSCHNGSVLPLSVALPEFDAVRANDASVSQNEDIILRTVATFAVKDDSLVQFHF